MHLPEIKDAAISLNRSAQKSAKPSQDPSKQSRLKSISQSQKNAEVTQELLSLSAGEEEEEPMMLEMRSNSG